MAEFCLKCWNEINKTDDPASKYILSKELDLCEGCGKRTHVIVAQRKNYYRHKLRFVILPFKIVYKILYIVWRILILPYIIYEKTSVFCLLLRKTFGNLHFCLI